MESIPVVDMLDFPAESGKLMAACEELGCFRVVNHGVPDSLQAEMKDAMAALFERPTEVKRRNKNTMYGSGYIEVPPSNPVFEQLGVYNGASPADVDAFCSHLDASPQQREVIQAYAAKLYGLAVDIAGKVAEGMGLAGACTFGEWACLLRPNKYTFTDGTVGALGVREHSDPSFLTVLKEDGDKPGLEMMDKSSGAYVPVNPVRGSLLVLMGDIAKVWSNGRLHNVRHRVMCKQAVSRLIIAMFLLAPKDGRVTAPDELAADGSPRLYRPFDYEEYLKLVFSSSLCAGQALSRFVADDHSMVSAVPTLS